MGVTVERKIMFLHLCGYLIPVLLIVFVVLFLYL